MQYSRSFIKSLDAERWLREQQTGRDKCMYKRIYHVRTLRHAFTITQTDAIFTSILFTFSQIQKSSLVSHNTTVCFVCCFCVVVSVVREGSDRTLRTSTVNCRGSRRLHPWEAALAYSTNECFGDHSQALFPSQIPSVTHISFIWRTKKIPRSE